MVPELGRAAFAPTRGPDTDLITLAAYRVDLPDTVFEPSRVRQVHPPPQLLEPWVIVQLVAERFDVQVRGVGIPDLNRPLEPGDGLIEAAPDEESLPVEGHQCAQCQRIAVICKDKGRLVLQFLQGRGWPSPFSNGLATPVRAVKRHGVPVGISHLRSGRPCGAEVSEVECVRAHPAGLLTQCVHNGDGGDRTKQRDSLAIGWDDV
jgi:hypothetical protein